jgi:hypothetical protein
VFQDLDAKPELAKLRSDGRGYQYGSPISAYDDRTEEYPGCHCSRHVTTTDVHSKEFVQVFMLAYGALPNINFVTAR